MSLKDLFEILVNADLTNLITLLVYGLLSAFAIAGVFVIVSALFGFAFNINAWVTKKRVQKELAQKRDKYRNYH